MFESVVSGRLLGFNLGDWMLQEGNCDHSTIMFFVPDGPGFRAALDHQFLQV